MRFLTQNRIDRLEKTLPSVPSGGRKTCEVTIVSGPHVADFHRVCRWPTGDLPVSEIFEPTLIIIGLILCLFGWTLYWVGLRLLGAFCGAVGGGILGGMVCLIAEVPQWAAWAAAGGGILGAALGVYLIKRAHYLLFFVVGALLGLATAYTAETLYGDWLARYLPEGQTGRLAFFAASSLLAGLLVLVLHRFVVIGLTSFIGTALFALGIPAQYATWVVLPLFLGSFLLQVGALAALGEAGLDRYAGDYDDEDED